MEFEKKLKFVEEMIDNSADDMKILIRSSDRNLPLNLIFKAKNSVFEIKIELTEITEY